MVPRGKEGGKGYLGSLGWTCTHCYVTNKDLLYNTGNYVQCYVAAWVGGEFVGEWICVCIYV